MKKIIFFSLIVLFMIGSCVQEKKSPIEGAWKLIYGNWYFSDTMNYQFPGNLTIDQIKMLSKEYVIWVGQYKMDTVITDNYGVGTYRLDGNKFEENIFYRTNYTPDAAKVKVLLEVRNDTLIQKWPADENWNLPEKYSTEKYVRLK
ncbi:MAG: hypothetical protein MUO72_09800 [Bacteroidales bacterium]|nr:hypothetical protein [Bacteroidales bacterium]